MLEHMSPWEYQEIRKVLGHGSGFDSPGWREIRRVVPALGQAFHALREQAGLSLVDVYVQGREHEELYQLAEALTELDERINFWRIRHYKVVARVIGDSVVGTQGTPVEVLGRLDPSRLLPGALARPQRADGALAGAAEGVSLQDEAVGLLQQLLRLNTVNPPGNETIAAELLRDYLEANGVEVELYARTPERANLVARLRAATGLRSASSRTRTPSSPTRTSGRAIPGPATSPTTTSGDVAHST